MMRSMAKMVLKKMDAISPSLTLQKKRMKDESETQFERGLQEESKNGCTHEALEYYKRAVQYDGQHYPAIFNLASCYEKQGKLGQTKRWLLRLLEVQANFAPAYTALTRLYM